MKTKTFMTGNWEDLIISTFEVDSKILEKYLPNGTELDLYQGKALISMVAFTFSKVKFFGVKVPFHQLFGEINYRFYVKSIIEGTRGVVFIKEYAPKPIIAVIANGVYNEPFFYKNIGREKETIGEKLSMQYSFPNGKVTVVSQKETRGLKENTLEHFIVDRYTAFVKSRNTKTYQYQINHKPWRLYKSSNIKIDKNSLSLLPSEFKNGKLIASYFVDGSEISVEKGILQQEKNNNFVLT
ncbi:MAG: DUF2071 domain-containing protein [Flavobacteriaceae bacterium]|nr:DUF2071 domain-containing protein [Flavobacteriaceae bacterium]